MRILTTTLLSFALPLACIAQTIPSQPVHCSVQQNTPATEADNAFAAGDFAKAEALYKAQIAAAPVAVAFAGLVHSQLEQDKFAEASASTALAASALPKSGDALALKGDVLLRAGQIPQSFTAYTQALAVDPCSPQAHLGVGRLDLLVVRPATAARELGQAHSLAPANPEVAAAYIETLAEPQHEAALKALVDSKPILPPSESTRLAYRLAALEQHKSCTAVPYTTADITMYPLMISGTHPRSWALKAKIDDAELPFLEMDTTVSGIVLNPKDAKRANVHPLMALPASPDAPYMGYADKIRIGNVEYHDCTVQVVPSRSLADLNSLIGLDFFRDHLIHIDYVTMLLTLNPLPPEPLGPVSDRFIAPEEKSWSPVYKEGANLLIPTSVNKKGPFLFALDTGSWRTIFSKTTAGNVVSCLHDSTLALRGVSGSIVKILPMDGDEHEYSQVTRPDGVPIKVSAPDSVSDLRYAGVDYIAQVPYCVDITPKSNATGIEISGLIGFADLSPFFIDINYRDALINLKYDIMRKYEARQLLRDE
jgi:Flp pilus assembly protein TadD